MFPITHGVLTYLEQLPLRYTPPDIGVLNLFLLTLSVGKFEQFGRELGTGR